MLITEHAKERDLIDCCKRGIPYWDHELIYKLVELDLLTDEKVAERIAEEYPFKIEEIVFKASTRRWTVKMELTERVENIGSQYVAALFKSPIELERAIKAYKREIKHIEDNPEMFPDEAKIEEKRQSIADCKERIKKLSAESELITFRCSIDTVKYTARKIEMSVIQPTAVAIAENIDILSGYTLFLVEQKQ